LNTVLYTVLGMPYDGILVIVVYTSISCSLSKSSLFNIGVYLLLEMHCMLVILIRLKDTKLPAHFDHANESASKQKNFSHLKITVFSVKSISRGVTSTEV